MPYATTADLIATLGAKRYAELTDPTYWNADNPTFDRGADALERASAEIDSYLSRRYALPLGQVPAVLKVLACDIAFCRLWETPPDDVTARYDKAVKWLEGVADGVIGLGLPGDFKPVVEAKRQMGSVALAL